MINAFIDANIFIRIATQGRPGCEQTLFDDLRTLVQDGTLTLLVPEVVYLEVDKAFRSLSKGLESSCDKFCDAVEKTNVSWNEIDSLKSEVVGHIKQYKQKRIEECLELSKAILEFLQLDSITTIPLTPEILVNAKCRRIAGKMRNCKKSSDQDVLIVESLVSYFHNANGKSTLFLFCTENTSDFALELKKQDLQRSFTLDPNIQDSLPRARCSTDLASMLEVTKGSEELPEPTNVEIEEAEKLRDLHDDIDDEMFTEAHQILTEAVNKESVRQFEEEILPSIPDDLRALRRRLSEKIEEILAKCRRCSSWGDRSEMKLGSWIEYVDESMIPYTSLPNLIKIRNNLERYLEIHYKMDSEGVVAE